MGLAALPDWVNADPQWAVAGAIVLLGLVIYGFKDLLKFSLMRARAISSVCFAESIRRRVLWIIPLAIFGVIIVAQLQHPSDEQDAVRQTTKVCLFATGLVVTITAIILACTSLPKEIENRVIYTIVTKPTTRLEIVVGKVMGFAQVSATILIIMGIFTLAYLQVRAWNLNTAITARLNDPGTDPAAIPTLTHYKNAGLLNARTYADSDAMQILSREPLPSDHHWWMYGAEGSFLVPFKLSPEQLISPSDPTRTPGAAGLVIAVQVGYEQHASPKAAAEAKKSALPDTISAPNALKSATEPAAAPPPPTISIDVLGQDELSLVASTSINGGKPIPLADPEGKQTLFAPIQPDQAVTLLKGEGRIYVQVRGNTPNTEYSVNSRPVVLAVPPLSGDTRPIQPVPDPNDAKRPTPPIFRTGAGTSGYQLRGGAREVSPLTFYHFRNAHPIPDDGGNVSFELRVGVERGADTENVTQAEAIVVNRSGGSEQRVKSMIAPESGRPTFFSVPASAVQGGNFEVLIRCLTPGQFLGVDKPSLKLVVAEHGFVLNLAKSLAVMWLMSLLVVIVAIFCSTFLSWPIALVLTVLILLGRWGVEQLGDSTAPGIGNRIATDMKLRDPSTMHVVSDSVEALTKMLNLMAKVLPDITRFSALEDIERGVSMPLANLGDSLMVILVFGVPLMVLAYVFLRNKEVAP